MRLITLATLAALASCVAAASLPQAAVVLRMVAIVFIATLCVYRALRVFSRWSSEHSSAGVLAHRAGRTDAVARAPPGRTSPIGQHALSLNQTHINENAGPSLPAEPPLEDPGPANDEPEPNFLPEDNHSIVSKLVPRHYERCTFHRQCCAVLENKAHTIWRDVEYHHSIHQVISSSSSSGSTEPISYIGGEAPPSPRSSTGRPGSNLGTPLIKSFVGLPIASEIIAFSILVIALDWSHERNAPLPGVKHDIEWLEKKCSGLESFIALHMLTGAIHTPTQATHRTIRSKILEMHRNAQPGTAVVIYLNGHGYGNFFMLYDGTVVDAATLVVWISEIRQETGKYLSVCIVLDHCQFESRAPPSVDLGQGIHILWAGMPGQRSADLKVAGDEDDHIPCSNFLKVLALVLAEARTRPLDFPDCLMSRMNFWMDLMVRMTRAIECRQEDCQAPCPLCTCPTYESCTHDDTRIRHKNASTYPRTQNPNGLFWGFEDCVCASELLERLEPVAKTLFDRLQETAGAIKGQEAYSTVKNNQVPTQERNLFQPSSSTTRRGRNVGAVAISTQPLP